MKGSRKIQVLRFDGRTSKTHLDTVAQEEPLEIRLEAAGVRQTVNTTMRTTGHDFELAIGWCLSEGLVARAEEIQKVSYCLSNKLEQRFNSLVVRLKTKQMPTFQSRHTLSTSACGVCGKANLEALELRCAALPSTESVTLETLYALPEKLCAAQPLFTSTGGIHAAALFSSHGKLLAVREDIGRHNAVDKLIGWAAMQHQPLEQTILLVSGRAGFEIAQKAITAQIPVLASVSAPSSLAVEVANNFNLTLIGFLRGRRMNVYAGASRIQT